MIRTINLLPPSNSINRGQFWLSGVIRRQQAATARTTSNFSSMHSRSGAQSYSHINRIHGHPHRIRIPKKIVSEISLFTNIHVSYVADEGLRKWKAYSKCAARDRNGSECKWNNEQKRQINEFYEEKEAIKKICWIMSLSPRSSVHCVAKMTFCVQCDIFKTKETNMLNGSWREMVVGVGVSQFVRMFNDSHLSMTRCSWQTILFAYNNGLPVLRCVRNRAFKAKWNCRHVNFTRVLGEFSASFVSATNEILTILNAIGIRCK